LITELISDVEAFLPPAFTDANLANARGTGEGPAVDRLPATAGIVTENAVPTRAKIPFLNREVRAISSAGRPVNPVGWKRPGGRTPPAGGYRWLVCAMLFAATAISNIDRQGIGILKPLMQADMGWSETQYADIMAAFTLLYAVGFLGVGRLMDAIGARVGLALAILAWSLAAGGQALARTATGFLIARSLVGLGGSGNIPGSIKVISEWFPARERAMATGFFNAGTTVAAVLTPLLIPLITVRWGWRAVFIATSALGIVWLIAWLLTGYRPEEHPRISANELAYIQSDGPESVEPIRWVALLGMRETWAFVAAKMLTDPVWWFYLFWLPGFLHARYGVQLAHAMLPLLAVYVAADLGSLGGGWFSSALIRRGATVNRGRKLALLVAAIAVVPVVFASYFDHLWVAVAIMAVALAAHQWWSANVFALVADLFPARAIGSVVGIGGFVAGLAGFVSMRISGRVLDANQSDYAPIFLVCGVIYLVALACVQLLIPRLRQAQLTPAVLPPESRPRRPA
jgi:ACS family hexuronate transporter-like MFS transporter